MLRTNQLGSWNPIAWASLTVLTLGAGAFACLTSTNVDLPGSTADAGGVPFDASSGADVSTVEDGSIADVASDGSNDVSSDVSSDVALTCLGESDAGAAPCAEILEDDAGNPVDGGQGCFGQISGINVCEFGVENLKSGVANAVSSCMKTLSPACSEQEVNGCVTAAVDRACPDPSATSFCTNLFSSCNLDGGALFAQCVKYASALNETGRGGVGACISPDGPCTGDPEACLTPPF